MAVLFAVLLPVLLIMVSFTTDVAMMASAKGQLGTASDAAALAGAAELISSNRVAGSSNLSREISSARTRAVQFAGYNKTLNAPTYIDANDWNSRSGDVVIGYLDPLRLSDPTVALNTDSSMTSLFNSVQVTTRRDASRNGLIPAAFGRILGYDGYEARVSSTATAQNYQVKGFDTTASRNTSLIPIVLSLDVYNAMISKSSAYADVYSYNRDTQTVTSGGDGITESDLYPVSSGAGNWGTVRIGVSNNGTSVLSSQIANGVSTSVMAPTYGSSMVASTSAPLIFSGNPGISLGIKSAIWSIIGKNVTIPIYDPNNSGGHGSNYTYSIVKFAAVTVLDFKANGSHSTLTIQPGLVTDSSLITGSASSSWTEGGVVRVFLSR
ncbi:MAG TPA: pilus assembly protein TadG-related protein [Isosphaeraceae bacterium]|nr:pilus assembly protein TadG-related protein [Isosphaeraceae bacterium]